MKDEIDRINRVLPSAPTDEKTEEIQRWTRRVIERTEHYKAEHYALLKEAISLLELALWKANLINNGEEKGEHPAKKAKIIDECGDKSAKAVGTVEGAKSDIDAARRAARITCGGDIIIKNVLPFLNDNDVFPLQNHHEAS